MASSKSTSTIQIQPRDIAILRGLLESRVMTVDHVSDILFEGKREMAKKRLQKLKSVGLIGSRDRHVTEPAVFHLTKKGIEPLHAEGVLRDYPPFDIPALERRAHVSDSTLSHELEVMSVKAAFHAAARRGPALSLAGFSTWPLLNQFTAFNVRGEEVTVRPDGFVRVHERSGNELFEHCFFVEVDRSTETQDALISRVGSYLDYYRSGGFAERNGASRSEFKSYPFRVIIVLKSTERRNNVAERLLSHNPPILSFVWLTTIEEATKDPFGAIYVRPSDYRAALEGSAFAQPSTTTTYKRRVARETRVESMVEKQRLIDSEA